MSRKVFMRGLAFFYSIGTSPSQERPWSRLRAAGALFFLLSLTGCLTRRECREKCLEVATGISCPIRLPCADTIAAMQEELDAKTERLRRFNQINEDGSLR